LNSDKTDKKNQVQVLLNSLIKQNKTSLESSAASASRLAAYLLNTKPQDVQKMEQANLNMVELAMEKPVTQETLPTVYKEAANQIDTLGFSASAEEIILIVTVSSIKPNLIYNQEATEKAIQEAQDKVRPVQKTIKVGEIIVREGDRVTPEQISILEQLGIQRTKSYPITLVGTTVFIFITFWLTLEFLRRYNKDIYDNHQLMLLLAIIFILVLLLTRIFTIIKIGDRPEINSLTGYLAPVAAGSMMVAILLDNRLAYFFTMIMALYVGLLTEGSQLSFAIAAFVGGTVGVYRVSHLSQTSDLAKSGLYIAGTNIATIITLFPYRRQH
jgi:membrane-associated HD superfamily phosphohydrolase